MKKTYTTVSGDTWDGIAYRELGSEYLFPQIMDANPKYIEYMVFPAGIELVIPEAELSTELSENYPEWRAKLNG